MSTFELPLAVLIASNSIAHRISLYVFFLQVTSYVSVCFVQLQAKPPKAAPRERAFSLKANASEVLPMPATPRTNTSAPCPFTAATSRHR
jgi:hypothetical protein